MRTILLFPLFLFLIAFPKAFQAQSVDSFSVVLAPNYNARYFNFPENSPAWSANGRGINYNIKGFLYPGSYFEENCPLTLNCGIVVDTIFDFNGDVLAIEVNPEDTTLVIGDWDCRSFIVGGNVIGTINDEETIGEIACQTFNFYPHPESPCPQGCYVVTEGLLDRVNASEDGKSGARSLTGGTNEFKYIRGDLTGFHLPSSNPLAADTIVSYGRNKTGAPNLTYNFKYDFLTLEDEYEWSLNISIKQQTLIVDGPRDSITGLPERGAILILSGVIYDGGVLDTNPNGGLDANGYAEYDSIGTWTMKGTWTSSDYDLNDGLFLVYKQYFELTHPSLGSTTIITDSESEEGTLLNEPLQQLVVGGTGQLMGHMGESSQTIIGQNTSGGWNISYTFETSGILTGTENLPKEPSLSLLLYPNPATNQLTVKLENIKDFGVYTIEISDVRGQRMLSRDFDLHSSTFVWNTKVSAFASGWYGLVLKKDGQVVGSKGFSKVR